MLLVKQDKVKTLTPYILHTTIMFGVVLYVVAGAVVIRWLEAKDSEMNVAESAVNSTLALPSTFDNGEASIPRLKRENKARKPTMKRSRKCVIEAIREINNFTKCDPDALNTLVMKRIDDCYLEDLNELERLLKEEAAEDLRTQQRHPSGNQKRFRTEQMKPREWSYMDAVLFCFTIITTIGYGNVVPETIAGRLFVMVYCCVGVPFAMLAIANLGKFLAEFLQQWCKRCAKHARRCIKRLDRMRKLVRNQKSSSGLENVARAQLHACDEDLKKDEGQDGNNRFFLILAFIIYIMIGSVIISSYEQLDYFEATYFNFITLTTIGLGDIVPQSETYLAVTLVYISIGVALSTIGIEIAAEYLKKLHYFGRKIKDVSKVQIWFGGHRLTMKQLVKNLGERFDLPENVVNQIDLDEFVDQAIKVEAGELDSIRVSARTRKITRKSRGTYSSLKSHLTTIIREPYLGFDAESLVFVDDEHALQPNVD